MGSPLRVAVASGKGGTGKTTVATGLALLLAERGVRTSYLDCDVEEPHGRFFLRPEISETAGVFVTTPVIDADRCTNCGRCCEVCRFNALAHLPDRILIFQELCHACGACALLCPEGAITEEPRRLGAIHRGITVRHALGGEAYEVSFLEGCLDVGEAHAVPVIRALRRQLPEDGVIIFDSPPGASCPVVETVRGADLVVLVTEPTPFGLSDLEQAIGVVRAVADEAVVVVNRAGMTEEGDVAAGELCAREGLSVLATIPEDRQVAACSARGEAPVLAAEGYAARLAPLVELIRERVAA